MILQEDYGNLGNLVAYLNGKDSLEDRIKKGIKIFFINLRIPPQHKEEVVILWLADILSTNKVLTLTLEEKELVWISLQKLILSKRLQALCSHHWVCPFTSAFMQTLLETTSQTTIPTIQENAFIICEQLLALPSLSPEINLLSSKTLSLCEALLCWLEKHGIQSKYIPFLITLLSASSDLLNESYKKIALRLAVDNFLLPLLKLEKEVTSLSYENTENLQEEVRKFLQDNVFHSDNAQVFIFAFHQPFETESQNQPSREGESIFTFLIRCIKYEDLDYAAFILKEFCSYFINSYRNIENGICYKLLVIIMHLIGISVKETPLIVNESSGSQRMKHLKLDINRRDKLIEVVLETILTSQMDQTQCIMDTSLSRYLNMVGTFLLDENKLSGSNLNSLILIAKINPLFLTNTPNLFSRVLVKSRSSNESYMMLDKFLCEAVEVYAKLRILNELFEKFTQDLISTNLGIEETDIFPELGYSAQGQPLLPINFLRKLTGFTSTMGIQMSLKLWSSIHDILSKTCRDALQRENSAKEIVSVVIWLSSLCVSSTSFIEAVSISGVATEVSDAMHRLAEECIEPLVADSITLGDGPGRTSVCRALMNLLLVWSELHSELLTTDTGYKTRTHFPLVLAWKSSSAKDFSSQLPFISSEKWTQLLSCLDESDDASRLKILQLLIQKVSFIGVQWVDCKARNVAFNDTTVRSLREECLDYILSVEDVHSFPLSTDQIAICLPSMASSFKASHLPAVARMFFSGIAEGREAWVQLGKSSFFKENNDLQVLCFHLLCDKLSSLLSGGKRKIDEEELEEIGPESNAKYLSQRILSNLKKLKARQKVEMGQLFELLLARLNAHQKKSVKRLSKRSSSEVVWLLRVLDFFPLSVLEPTLLMSVVSFLFVVVMEEGGFFNGRTEIVQLLLLLMNRVAASRHSSCILTFAKEKSKALLSWLITQCEEAMSNVTLDYSHLKVALQKEEPSSTKLPPPLSPNFTGKGRGEVNIVEDLIYLLNSFMASFVQWSTSGMIYSLADHLRNQGKETAELNETYLLASLMLVNHLGKRLETTVGVPNYSLIKTLEVLGQWSLEISQATPLSKVTNVVLANCLVNFSAVLSLARTMEVAENIKGKTSTKIVQHKRKIKEKEETKKEDRKEASNEEPFQDMNWEALISNGVRLTGLVPHIENAPHLQKLCLTFFTAVASSSKASDEKESCLNIFDNINYFISNEDEGIISAFSSFFENIQPNHYKRILETLLRKTQKNMFQEQVLSQWFIIVSMGNVNKAVKAVKANAVQEALSIFCLQIANENKDSEADHLLLTEVIRIMQAAVEMKEGISIHAKSLVLSVFPKLLSVHSPNQDFSKVFSGLSTLLSTMMWNEYRLVSDRPTSIASAFTQLVFAVMARADEAQQTLSNNDAEVIMKCSDSVERIAKLFKKVDYHFSKIMPFFLAKILDRMQQARLIPKVKESMERVVFFLFDFCDHFALQHLMVALPPDVTTLLKHYHKSFNEGIKFNPIAG